MEIDIFSFINSKAKSSYEMVRQYIQYIENRYEQFKIKEDYAVYQYRFFCPGDSSLCEDLFIMEYAHHFEYNEIEGIDFTAL